MAHEDQARTAREFWIGHATQQLGTRAVHPSSRWGRYHAWTRRMLQAWTLARMRAGSLRYRRCVDLGCGIGDWTAQFAEIADEIHACDVAPRFVAETRQRVPVAVVECADLRDYQLPRMVDLVYVGAVLSYVPDTDALDVFRRIRAATIPGALVVVRDYCAFNLGRATVNEEAGFYSVHRTPRDLVELARRAGLSCVESRSSPSMYGEVMAHRMPLLQWPLRALWRLATAGWLRASHTFVLRA